MQLKQQIARSSMSVISRWRRGAADQAVYGDEQTTRISAVIHRSPIGAFMVGLLFVGAVMISSIVKAAETTAGDPMAVYYENTLTCAGGEKDNWLCYNWYYPGGYFREMQVIRRRDGFMSLHGREGTFKVTKTATGMTLCQTFDGSAHTWCRELTAHAVGDQWTETLASGQPQKFSILKGRGLLNFMIGNGTDTHILAPYTYADYPPDPKNIIDNVGAASR